MRSDIRISRTLEAWPWGARGRVTAVILLATLLGGCHVQQRVALPGEAPPGPGAVALEPGDRVRITMRDGTNLALTVAEVRAEELVGTDGRRVRFDAMAQLEVRHLAKGRTALLVGGGATLAIAFLVLLLTAAAYGSFLSGG